MHEFSIAQALVESAIRAGQDAGLRGVNRLVCRVGVLRHVELSLLREAFLMVSEGTGCAGAELQVETTYLRARCSNCSREFEVRDWLWICPVCGGAGSDAQGGDELDLICIEGEADDNAADDFPPDAAPPRIP